MADERRLNKIASRYDLQIGRNPDPWKRSLWRWTAVAAVVTCLIAAVPFVLRDHRWFQSRVVSNAHRSFGEDCQQCHDRSLIPVRRLMSFNNSVHSTSGTKCRECHREANLDHVAHLKPADFKPDSDRAIAMNLKNRDFDCATCHVEHRGSEILAQVADHNCTGCHVASQESLVSQKYDLKFDSFQHHPEFAIWSNRVASLVALPESSNRLLPVDVDQNSQVIDKSNFRFNHHRHLDPNLPGPVDSESPEKLATASLQCNDCHEPDASSTYFRPIRFDSHCARCHKLGVREVAEVPHVAPEIIRGTLLDLLAKVEFQIPSDQPSDVLGGPTKPPLTNRVELNDKLGERLAELEKKLFDAPRDVRVLPKHAHELEEACNKCHITEEETGKWTVLKTEIPEKWMPHTRFRHDLHTSMDCTHCHSRDGHAHPMEERSRYYPDVTEETKSSPSIYASKTARDVLMPRIEVCQKCHREDSVFAAGAVVSDRCVDCHSYHHVPKGTELPKGIDKLLTSRDILKFLNKLE